MKAAKTSRAPSETGHVNDSVFDDADALIALAQESFRKAAGTQVAENDCIRIATHGSVGGKIVTRNPGSGGPS